MKKRTKKKLKKFFRGLWKGVLAVIFFIVKIPYYVYKLLRNVFRRSKEKKVKREILKKRGSIKSKYEEFRIVEEVEGDYKDWLKKLISSDSQIGIILGARGSGKTAIGMKLIENIHSRSSRKCFAMGFSEEELPSWISVVEDVGEIKNDSFVLVDEGGILFSSRSSMSNANKLLSKLILIARHKNISILFISQNSSNLEINVLRQADTLLLKPSSLLQKDFERKIVQKVYTEVEDNFKRLKKNRGITYIYSEEFKGFVSNPLPSFWGSKISKGFR